MVQHKLTKKKKKFVCIYYHNLNFRLFLVFNFIFVYSILPIVKWFPFNFVTKKINNFFSFFVYVMFGWNVLFWFNYQYKKKNKIVYIFFYALLNSESVILSNLLKCTWIEKSWEKWSLFDVYRINIVMFNNFFYLSKWKAGQGRPPFVDYCDQWNKIKYHKNLTQSK